MASHICGIWKKMIQINVITEQKETHRLRKWTYGCQGEWIVRDFGKVIYTLLYLKWMTNEDLLYSAWNLAQCYIQLGWEELQGRIYTCMCMAESFHYSPATTTTFLIGYSPIQNKKFKDWGKKILHHEKMLCCKHCIYRFF